MEENKILEMLAQLLQSQTELKQELKQDIQEVKDLQLRMEAEFSEKIGGLYYFMAEQRDFNEDVIRRLDGVAKSNKLMPTGEEGKVDMESQRN